MKKLLTTLVFTVFTVAIIVAQNEANLPEPEFEMQPYWYDEGNNTLRSFEKVAFQSQNRSKGLYGAEGLSFIEGRESPIQFKSSKRLTILIKVEKGKDPSDFIGLYQFKVKKKRELVTAKRSAWDGGETKNTAGLGILEYKKIKDGLYKILIIQNLEQGEYAFANGKFFFAFGIE